MNQCRLGQGRQCLVQAVDHHIRSGTYRIPWKFFQKRKMRSMGLVHNQRNSMAMNDFSDFLHPGNHPVISGRSNQHRLNLRLFFESFIHIFRKNHAVYPQKSHGPWINIRDMKPPEKCSMIGRFVTISCHQNGSAKSCASGYGGKNTCRTSIDQIMCLLRAVQTGCPFLSLQKQSFCMMQIIKSVNFCYINRIRIPHLSHTSLMTRHMHGKTVRIRIFP